MKPPLLPLEILARVTRLARLDGMSVLLVAGGFALISAAFKDVTGAFIGLLVAGGGALELHGVSLLRARRAEGMRWLVSAQLFLMAVILTYVSFRLAHPDVDFLLKMANEGPSAEVFQQAAEQKGMTVKQLLVELYNECYVAVAVLTIIYQGGMTLYYLKRRAAVENAVGEQP
jgi:hypothetical protein